VAPCICPERPTARTAARAGPERPFTAHTVACHQASGSCSENPGAGRLTSRGAEADPEMAPCSVRSTALTLEVPMSMPRYRRRAPLCGIVAAMVAVSDCGCQLKRAGRVMRSRELCSNARKPTRRPPRGACGTLAVGLRWTSLPDASRHAGWATGAEGPMSKTAAPVTLALRPRADGATLLRWLYDEIRLAIVQGRLPAG